MDDTLRLENVSTRLLRIAKLAREAPERTLTTLAHHIDVEFLREAYRRTRKDGAAGVDGQTACEYERDLEANLQSLLNRFKSGAYWAPPVRRVHIPKGDGSKTRPIGIPTFEDKILQRAVSMVLEAVYEQDFLPCSYGFRPRRSAHQALKQLRDGLMEMGGGWVLEVDIQGYFDALDHSRLREFLDKRVRDGVLRRSIDKWLKAGVMEEGQLMRPKTGSPQGGVISPILSNVYLHEVLDKWFEETVKPRLKGKAFLVRFADDFLLVFAVELDARRVFDVLPKRFAKYGLTLHPEKTRLVRFHRPRSPGAGKGRDAHGGRPGTFDLLGFRHVWGRARNGHWVIKQKTMPSRFGRALRRIAGWCRRNLHRPIKEQYGELVRKLQGHYAYYGITGNSVALARFRREALCCWRQWLHRRSQRSRMTWAQFNRLLEHYRVPPAKCVHSIYVT
ncbi:MAG: group II intron reverse transcriptase/maturase [Candidatus Methylomirabilales bacterium]